MSEIADLIAVGLPSSNRNEGSVLAYSTKGLNWSQPTSNGKTCLMRALTKAPFDLEAINSS